MNRFKRFLTGKTRTGQVVYGIVDALPIPNLLNPIRAVIGQSHSAGAKDILAGALAKTDKIRLAISVVVSYLILSGRVSVETINELIDVLIRIL